MKLYSRINWQVGRDLEGSSHGHGLIQVPSQHFLGATQKPNCFSHQTMVWTICGSNPGCCHISKTPRPALGPNQPHNRWTPVFFPRVSRAWVVKLTICLHLVLRVKNEWSYSSSALYASVSQPLWDRGEVNSFFHKTRARSQQIYS